MGRSYAAIASNSGRNSGPEIGRPQMFEKIWNPRAPSCPTARCSSRSDASGSLSGSEATKPGNRAGYRRTRSAMPSFAACARSMASDGLAKTSIGGVGSDNTCS